jgi:5-methylcytosine-specific restriction endonuclease McrA
MARGFRRRTKTTRNEDGLAKPKKKKRKKKERTEAKVRSAVFNGMRSAFAEYSPKYQAVKDRCKVRVPRYNKDGSRHKVDLAFHKCELCGNLVKSDEIQIDHVQPVVPIGTNYRDMSLDELFSRMDCDESNLQALCKECHDKKSKEENEQRKIRKGKTPKRN